MTDLKKQPDAPWTLEQLTEDPEFCWSDHSRELVARYTDRCCELLDDFNKQFCLRLGEDPSTPTSVNSACPRLRAWQYTVWAHPMLDEECQTMEVHPGIFERVDGAGVDDARQSVLRVYKNDLTQIIDKMVVHYMRRDGSWGANPVLRVNRLIARTSDPCERLVEYLAWVGQLKPRPGRGPDLQELADKLAHLVYAELGIHDPGMTDPDVAAERQGYSAIEKIDFVLGCLAAHAGRLPREETHEKQHQQHHENMDRFLPERTPCQPLAQRIEDLGVAYLQSRSRAEHVEKDNEQLARDTVGALRLQGRLLAGYGFYSDIAAPHAGFPGLPRVTVGKNWDPER